MGDGVVASSVHFNQRVAGSNLYLKPLRSSLGQVAHPYTCSVNVMGAARLPQLNSTAVITCSNPFIIYTWTLIKFVSGAQ